MNFQQRIVSIVACLSLLALAGCEQFGIGVTAMADIQKQSAAYEDKEVTVRGVAGKAVKLPFIGTRLYRLKDEGGEVMVSTSGDLPADGAVLIVHGRIENALIVDGRGYGVLLQEKGRQKAWLQ